MADVKGALSDPDFAKLDKATQKQVLGRIDPNFADLSDSEFDSVVSRIRPQSTTPQNRPGFMNVVGNAITHGPSQFMDFISGHPIQTLSQHGKEMGDRAKQEWAAGNRLPAIGYGAASFLPGIGDEATQAGEEFGAGNVGGGLGHSLLALSPFAFGPLAEGASRLSVSPGVVGAARGLYKGLTDIPAVGKVIRIPQAIHEGYKASQVPTGAGYSSVPPEWQPGYEMPPVTPTPRSAPRNVPTTQSGPGIKFPEVTPSSGVMPSGRVIGPRVGEIVRPESFPQGRLHNPIWGGVEGANPSSPAIPELSIPKPTALPSGRVPGMPTKPATLPAKSPVQPIEGDATVVKPGDQLAPIDKFEMNRLAHARAQEMELLGSPKGKNGHPQLSQAARDAFGIESWSKLSAKQMRLVYDFMESKGRMPVKGEIKQ